MFFGDGTSVHSLITVPHRHLCGWNNLIHGGIISTLLDEIMSGSVVYVLRTMGMTRSLSVDLSDPYKQERRSRSKAGSWK
jgi:acyl-coenzyme A thioesterase PaaI-like protein